MRILIATGVPRQQEAGTAAVVLNHARELQKRGHQVTSWFLEDVLEKPAKWRRFEALWFAAAVARRILEMRGEFDVVNIHAPYGCTYGLRRKFGKRHDAPPYVFTMHGCDERFVRAMLLERRRGRAPNFGLKNRLWHRMYHRAMFDLSIRSADAGAVVNREGWICSEMLHRGESGHVWYVPNGVEEKFFLNHEYGEGTASRILYVGTWLDRKGVYYLAEAFRMLAGALPEARLTVAGCFIPEEEVRKSFVARVQDRVTVIPFVAREEMPNLYARHDLFVLPSLAEGMPLALLEAMAAGMPVVTTESSGMADVVEDELNGLLVPPADSEGLFRALSRLCGSAELRRRLGKEAQRTMQRYTWEQVTQKLEKILILAARTGSEN
jgi:glycosyltransferase involved in cell wall biosynthesis